ncbi:MAG: RagB/SusD family nutrient uptake outer membrane protein, partial [Sphingobacteriaceae bacterium]
TDDLLLAVENERRIEFAWEAHRWFDLARTGRAKTVLEAIDPTIKVDAHETVFPIPVTQLQLDKNLEQNPGY